MPVGGGGGGKKLTPKKSSNVRRINKIIVNYRKIIRR